MSSCRGWGVCVGGTMTDGVVKTKSSWGRTPGVLRELGVPLFVLLLCFFPQDDIPSRAGGSFRGQLLETGNSD